MGDAPAPAAGGRGGFSRGFGDRGGERGRGDRGRGRGDRGRGRGRGKRDDEEAWVPCTKLGRLVQQGKVRLDLRNRPAAWQEHLPQAHLPSLAAIRAAPPSAPRTLHVRYWHTTLQRHCSSFASVISEPWSTRAGLHRPTSASASSQCRPSICCPPDRVPPILQNILPCFQSPNMCSPPRSCEDPSSPPHLHSQSQPPNRGWQCPRLVTRP